MCDWLKQLTSFRESFFAQVKLGQHKKHAMIRRRDFQRALQQIDRFIDVFVSDYVDEAKERVAFRKVRLEGDCFLKLGAHGGGQLGRSAREDAIFVHTQTAQRERIIVMSQVVL